MAWKYKDLVNAGRDHTIREITEDEMRYGLPEDYNVVGRYAAQDVNRVGYRGDYGVGDNAFLSDEDWNAVQDYKNQWQYYKSIGDQAGMDAAHEAAQKLRYKYGYSGGADGSEYNTIVANTAGMGKNSGYGDLGSLGGGYGAQGGYMSQYDSQIDALLNAILGREAFSYNKDEDPLYQQYKESYTRAGNRAMQDTLAQLSARTGGLASSYAGGASQQAYNNYMAQLADKVPELYQLAYDMYQDDLANDRADLEMLLGIDDTYYSRYRDDVADSQWQQTFDYNASRDQAADRQWQQQFDYNANQDAQEWAYMMLQDAMSGSGGSSGSGRGSSGSSTGGKETGAAAESSEYGGSSMNTDHFRASMQSIAQQLAANKLEAAEGNVNRIWDQLSEEQRQQLSELLDKYGLTTE